MKKRILSIVYVFLLCFFFTTTVSAAEDTLRLYDEADLLTASEENSLTERLDSVSEKYQVDIIIVTLETVGYYTTDEYIEMLYDENNFGYGENRDGVLLLVTMQEREYRILSNGFGADAISMDDIEWIGDSISYELSDGNYADAFHSFIDECEYEIDGELYGFPFPFFTNLLICVGIGFVAALISTGIMRSKLKSVRKQLVATEYMRSGSMQVTTANDLFLYRTIQRRKKESGNSNSSRSSGSSRNVGGGKF